MQVLCYILFGYLVGAVLIAARLGWHMGFRLDRFDWHYSKGDIWTSFVLCVLLWPLMLFKPQNVIDPRKLFEGSFGVSARMREEARLWSSPPPCGPLIRYRQGHGCYEETFGEFVFHVIDLEDALVARLQNNPHLAKDQEGAILNWLRQCDNSISEPTAVPEAWWHFQFIADEVVREGRAEVCCLKCDMVVPNNKLLARDDHGQPSWNFNRLLCPRGHPLLVVETMHILMRPNNDAERANDA